MNRTALLLALAAGAACSPSAPVATDDAGGPTDDLSAALGVDAAAALADLSSGGGAQDLSRVADLAMMAGYPAGPYGTTVGSTMANFHWEGYRDDLADAVATTKPYGAYSLDDLRRSGRTHAMVHLSEVF